MIIIGEKLNSSVPKTLEALNNRDERYIISIIKKQAECGADYIDINTALTGEKEAMNMRWVIKLVTDNSDCGIMLDSPNPDVAAECISYSGTRKLIINSISLDAKFKTLIEAAKSYGAGLVCLPIKDRAVPQAPGERLNNAVEIINMLQSHGIPDANIYIDALVEAVSTNQNAAITTLDTIKLIKEKFPEINTICGLSNVSFGLPGRAELNASFLSMAMQCGLDAAIMDITSERIQSALYTSNTLLAADEYCLNYIEYFKSRR